MDPYLGEIRIVAGNFAPLGWSFCNGQVLPIAENEALFSLIGTVYGGDGVESFALPDLRGRTPVGLNVQVVPGIPTNVLGQRAGTETVTLTAQQIPAHTHTIAAGGAATTTAPANAAIADTAGNTFAAAGSATAALANSSLTTTGGNQPHENMPPFLVTNFIIATAGIFPSSN